ncbi:codeine O-demethylase-like isoform X2 [Andrographis paniculata]|uniref:codeine O-demethylase-like isoform X2 n=1 Tax=Andrographis paniculata TaxID=175694 RepID=UPI0021E82216|nr:codeine O-demethylase-like isoform X2 [Andrographis paniculata]
MATSIQEMIKKALLRAAPDHRRTAFHSACKDWGIFQLLNHGVDATLLDELKREIHGFYHNLPLEERLKYKKLPGEVEGYGQTPAAAVSDDGQKIDWADRFYIITNPLHIRKSHLFPCLPPPLREALEAYMAEQQKLTAAILGLIAEALEMEAAEMADMFDDGMQSMRMTYYPPCPEPEKVIGLTPHSDACAITILLQVNGVEGLQVKKDGVWMPVGILPDAIVVNLGDITEILSNGLYKSIEHRATVNSEKERISIAMFFSPKLEAEVGPAPSLLKNTGEPPRFRRMKMEDYSAKFFSKKLDGKSFLHYMRINREDHHSGYGN